MWCCLSERDGYMEWEGKKGSTLPVHPVPPLPSIYFTSPFLISLPFPLPDSLLFWSFSPHHLPPLFVSLSRVNNNAGPVAGWCYLGGRKGAHVVAGGAQGTC
jgi:hypothetical protein